MTTHKRILLILVALTVVGGVGVIRNDKANGKRIADLESNLAAFEARYERREIEISAERRVWQFNAEMLNDRHWEDSQQVQACLQELVRR